jgi:hypothetical protein
MSFGFIELFGGTAGGFKLGSGIKRVRGAVFICGFAINFGAV